MMTSLVQAALSFLPKSSDTAVIFVSTFMIAYVCYQFRKRRQSTGMDAAIRHPPSLKSWPIIGSIPFLPDVTRIHRFFLEKKPSMGPVIRFKLMSRNHVVLQTREAIAEAFAKAEISNRPFKLLEEDFFNWPKKGIISLPYTAEFRKYHQLTLTILKQFGFGKMGGVMEARIHNEVAFMIAEFKSSASQPMDPMNVVDNSVFNVIASVLFGKRYERDDPQLLDFLRQNTEFARSGTKSLPLAFIPTLRYIPYYKRVLAEIDAMFVWYDGVMQQKIDECMQDDTETPCFIRSFIEAEGSQTYDKVQLRRTLQDLVFAGSETSSTTVRWSIVLLANHQEIQTRLQSEIDGVVPRERLPCLDDRSQLKLVEAFILEVMRFKTILPLGLAHEVTKNVVVQGFFLPTDTAVISNLYAVHMDPNVWGDPEIFRPDRFIDKEGRIVNRDNVIPFCIGKRSCLGELLARQEIFLFIAGLLQNFTVLPPDGQDTVECDEMVTGTIAPSSYAVRLVPSDTCCN